MELKNFEMTQERRGVFQGHEVWGKQYKSADGESSWFVGAWPVDEGESHICWVSGQNVLAFAGNASFDGKQFIQMLGPIGDMKTEMKTAILKAVGEWESKAKVKIV
jgi:hypothetical protein